MRALELSPRGTSVSFATAAPGAGPASSSVLVRRSSLKSMRLAKPQRPALGTSTLAFASTTAMSSSSSGSGSAPFSTTTVIAVAVAPGSQPGKRRVRRLKSYSESGLHLERALASSLSVGSSLGIPSGPPSVAGSARSRPYSAGDVEELTRRARVVSISGFSKSANGTWFFKVDVGSHAFDGYAVRRRFTDFKLLYEGLQYFRAALELPPLPPHGFYSVVQIFVSPDKALATRAKQLQELLEAINRHPVLSRSSVFSDFLGTSPSAADGYVSLSGYEVPDARFDPSERSGSSSYSLGAFDSSRSFPNGGGAVGV